ncbi:MAG: pilus assembly PilX N-terminal domain-containing protein [Armatimonadota bacterium]
MMTTRKYVPNNKRGIVFLTAIIGLAVMFIVGISYMGMATQQLGNARRDLRSLHALAMAEAGLNYIIYQKQQSPSITGIRSSELNLRQLNPGVLSTDAAKQFGADAEDRFNVWLLTVPDNPKVYQVVSQGVFREGKPEQYLHTVRAFLIPPETKLDGASSPLFKYAIFSDSELDIKSQSTIHGDVGSNTLVDINNKPVIDGYAVVPQGQKVTTDKKTTYGGTVYLETPVALSPFDFATYRAKAAENGGLVIDSDNLLANPDLGKNDPNQTKNWSLPDDLGEGKTTFTFPPAPGNIVFVDGELEIEDDVTFTNAGTIVVTGGMRVNKGSIYSELTSTSMLMIFGGDVRVNSNNTRVDATLYTQGTYSEASPSVLNGGAISKKGATTSAFSVITYVPLDEAVQVIPPGESTTQKWTIVSWEKLN